MTTLLNILTDSETEERIFRSLAQLEIATASEIAKDSNLKRTTIYSHLEKLLTKGLILESIDRNKKYYKTNNLYGVKQIVDEKISNLRKLQKDLPQIMEKLKSDKPLKSKTFTYYYGKNGISELMREAATSKSAVYFLGSTKGLWKAVDNSIAQKFYTRIRRRNFTKDYIIADWDPITVSGFKAESNLFTERRFLPPSTPQTGCIGIINNKIALIKFVPDFQAVVMDEPTIVEFFKLSFLSLWNDLEGKNLPN